MADVAVSFLLQNLAELVSETGNLIGARGALEWIETEFRVMIAFLASIDDVRHLQISENGTDRLNKCRIVIRKAEDVTEIYAKRASEMKMDSVFKRPMYLMKMRNLGRDLEKIKDQIIRVREGCRGVDFHEDLSSSSSSPHGLAAAAINKLDAALKDQDYVTYLHEGIQWVRDELAPLHFFLQQIDHQQQHISVGERQKLWVQEFRDIFQFVNDAFPRQQQLGGAAMTTQRLLLYLCVHRHTIELNLGSLVSVIQDKILQLYRRYYTYAIGGILVDNGSRSISPKIRLTTPVPDVMMTTSMSIDKYFKLVRVRPRTRGITHSSWLTPSGDIELLRVDLRLMKALLEDTRSLRDLDGRVVKVWLNQMHETCSDLEALDEHASQDGIAASKLRRIGHEIHDLAIRKMTYSIGNALGEEEGGVLAAHSFEHNSLSERPINPALLEVQYISKAELERRVKPVRRELQLMEALFEDVKRMEKLDARLKFWVEEMLGLASQANAAVQLDCKSYYQRIRVATRIRQINGQISILSKQKHNYDIADVKPTRSAVRIFNHNLEQTGPQPPKRSELIRREIKLIQALDIDIAGIAELDGTSEAWVDEMCNITKSFTAYSDTENIKSSSVPSILSTGLGQIKRKRRQLSDLDRIKSKIRQLSEIRIAYGIEPRNRLPPHIVPEIKAKLIKDYEHHCIIPILGMSSAQKEALRELIDNDNAIRCHFDWHAWVTVPQEFTATSISECIAKQIMEQQNLNAPTEEGLLEILQDPLPKRYLIILDEIRTIEVWNCTLERAFRQVSTGSKIMLITNEHTFSLLNSNSNSNVIFEVPVNLRELVPSQNVSYSLRQCIYYFLLFPDNYEVPSRRLICLWDAEGVVRSTQNENESVEHVAERYLNELVALNLVHVTKKKPNGKVKACQLSDGIRDGWFVKAKEAKFFQDSSDMVARLVDHHGSSDSCFIQIHGNPNSSSLLQNYRNIISFLSFDTHEGSKPGEDIGNFVRDCVAAKCFLGLRVLDLERVFRPKLPKGISKLTRLRYLGLRWTYLENLPPFVSQLLNLRVLDVKHTYINVLPQSIWSMQYLRHLYLSEAYRTRFTGRPSSISLTQLQTLWGAFIDENTWVTQGLDTLLNIRKLGLSCRSTSSQQLQAISKWISNLEYLEILRLKSRDEHGNADVLHLSPLTGNQNLSTVYLLGKLNVSVVHEFPVNLTDITLSGSELCVDPLEYLEKLPKLVILRLLCQSVVCKKMHCSNEGFPELKVLRIWKLEHLEEWEVEEGSMRYLEDLEIRPCLNLKTLPDALQRVNTFKKLKLTSMPQAFMDQPVVRQPELWAKVTVE